jgi:hypothetical protein
VKISMLSKLLAGGSPNMSAKVRPWKTTRPIASSSVHAVASSREERNPQAEQPGRAGLGAQCLAMKRGPDDAQHEHQRQERQAVFGQLEVFAVRPDRAYGLPVEPTVRRETAPPMIGLGRHVSGWAKGTTQYPTSFLSAQEPYG